MKFYLKPTTILLLIFSSFMSVGWGLECQEGEVDLGWGDCNEGYIFSDDTYSECLLIEDCPETSICDEGYTEIEGECYSQVDLNILQDFINLNENLSEEELLEIGD